jgi:transcriptional/translational regulatory protein YebC/TACO1
VQGCASSAALPFSRLPFGAVYAPGPYLLQRHRRRAEAESNTVPWAAVFEKRKHKIFARNAKLSKLFTRIGKEIAMAVKAGGPNPDSNHAAEDGHPERPGMNMPKDNMDRAIKKAAGGEEADFAE